jgi:hypothetical protein
MPEPQTFIVGRQAEVERFSALLDGRTPYWLLNIFGPGGIGKTIVGHKIQIFARSKGVPFAFIDGSRTDLSPDRMLYEIKEGLCQSESLASSFGKFEREYEDYLIVQDVLKHGGGMNSLFETVGAVKDPVGLAQIVSSLGKGISETVNRTIQNRFALERYLRGVEKTLTTSLSEGVSNALEKQKGPVAILMDTYEDLEGLDDWVCRTLVRALPEGVKIVVLGRNALPRINFDWKEFGNHVSAMDLPELGEADAKAYLVHFGLRDSVAQDQVYKFTGGYPLLLVLVRHLAQEAGGWDKIGQLEGAAELDQIATQLLNRILREERVKEVQAFLEKGVVARWFDPEIVSVLLEINLPDARKIYDKLSRHSFVERHPNGLKFHDKIRELLLQRLKFTSKGEFERLNQLLQDYFAGKAGIKTSDEAEAKGNLPQNEAGKYTIIINNAQGVTIGDQNQVSQDFSNQDEKLAKKQDEPDQRS